MNLEEAAFVNLVVLARADGLISQSERSLLERYLERFHSRLGGGIWLFPGKDGRHKAQRTMSQQVTETLAKRTGLTMTPHQFRHLAAKLILDNEPGD